MALKPEDVLRIAALAHLKLADEELETFRGQMSSVLEYVGKLSKAGVEGLEPAAHVTGVRNILREDAVRPADPAEREALLAAAPHREGDLVKVRNVFR